MHFINSKGDIVTRLIGLLKLLNYKKANISKCQISYIARM